jgi:uncharacterized protein (TIGR04168 family)
VIGDVHDQWEEADDLALQKLGVDLALFVGDFGNESVEVVRAIANLPLPIAVALGNHDAWYSATPWGQQKCPYDRNQEDWVQSQLDLLGPAHVGYTYRSFNHLDLGVVGGRPFSWGGPDWKYGEFYQQRFGVADLADSTARIVEAGLACPQSSLIVLSHNGPLGLGAEPEAPCGKDWQPIGGDHGDPDLQAAIATLKAAGKQIPLVAFGHMHHQLRHTRQRQRQALLVQAGTIYLNAACVPRIQLTPSGALRNLTLVTFAQGAVRRVELVWLGSDLKPVSQKLLYESALPLAAYR